MTTVLVVTIVLAILALRLASASGSDADVLFRETWRACHERSGPPAVAVAERRPPLNASPWCSKVAALSEPIRPEFTRLLRRLASIPTGSPACQSEQSTRHYRRQSAEFPCRSPTRVLDASDRRSTLVCGECIHRLGAGLTRRAVAQPHERGLRDGERRRRFLRGTTDASVAPAGRNDRGHQLLRHPRSQAHAGATRRLRSSQCRRYPLQRRRSQCQDRQFRLFRHDHPYHRPRARDGQWSVAPAFLRSRSTANTTGTAGSSPIHHCNGWSMQSSPRHVGLSGRPVERAGECPRNLFEVMTREKEIRYSSRTRAGTDQFKHLQKLRHALAGLLGKLPDDLKSSPEARLLGNAADRTVYNIVHLIYRAKTYEGHSRTMSFRASAWRNIGGRLSRCRRTLRHSEVLERPTSRKDS